MDSLTVEVSKPCLLYLNHSKSFMEQPPKEEHVTVKEVKRTVKTYKKCDHTWEELDGKVHEDSYGVFYHWFSCSKCKRKQRRNIT